MSSGSIVQTRPTIGMAFQTLTISNDIVGLDSAKYRNTLGNATKAYLTLEDSQVRYTYDNITDPTTTVGHALDPGGFLVIEGLSQMSSIKFIRVASDATAQITYERE